MWECVEQFLKDSVMCYVRKGEDIDSEAEFATTTTNNSAQYCTLAAGASTAISGVDILRSFWMKDSESSGYLSTVVFVFLLIITTTTF